MSTALPPLLRLRYAEAAEAYLRSLPLEHFMEAVTQSTQRKITVVSMDLVRVHRPEIQTFSELLVQYPLGRKQVIRQVVPDNCSVVHEEPIRAEGSFDVPFQPGRPFLVMEYVSKNSKRKDYEENHRVYERELKVPYYLVFYPEIQELTLFRLRAGRYGTVKPGANGRLAIPRLELEVAIHEDWVRFWFRGSCCPCPRNCSANSTTPAGASPSKPAAPTSKPAVPRNCSSRSRRSGRRAWPRSASWRSCAPGWQSGPAGKSARTDCRGTAGRMTHRPIGRFSVPLSPAGQAGSK